jgi:hypothetical protein
VVGRGSRRGARGTERSHAGYLELIDGQVDSQETAATIIELAVKGALTVQSDGEHDFWSPSSTPARLQPRTKRCC